ncbi:MAG: amidohydrolase [Clostridiaceae bacterium]|nr:amidohydrolase [Clostridiaceae bacterium]
MGRLLIRNGKVITITGKEYDNGYIVCENGKIVEIGENYNGEFDGKVINAKGNIVMPGFIDPHCHVGMFNDSLNFEGSDGNECTEPVTPQLRAIDGIYHNDRYFKEACAAGVTTVVTGPGSANVFGGQFAALKTHGSCVDDMVLKAPVAMKAALGENPKTVYNSSNKMPTTRMATASLMRQVLIEAKEYLMKKDKYEKDPENNDKPSYDMKLEALVPVLKGELILKIHAHRADDIATAVRIKNEFNLNITVDHCTEGYLVADLLKKYEIPVICGPIVSDRSKPELSNMIDENAKILCEKGLDVAIMTDHPVTPIKYLPFCAMVAHKAGLGREEALKAITINAAKVNGIADRVGSLEVGKDADIVILSGDPLDFMTRVTTTIINGEVVFSA